jgi:hypothetical protein
VQWLECDTSPETILKITKNAPEQFFIFQAFPGPYAYKGLHTCVSKSFYPHISLLYALQAAFYNSHIL